MGADVVVTYAPGSWAAAAGPGCWLLADAPVADAAVGAFVALMAGGLDGPGLLAALADSGLVSLDSFAVVVAGRPGVALARGAAHVEIADANGDVWTVDSEGASTWVEARLPDEALTVTLATGRDALADAASSGQQEMGGDPVAADLLVVDWTPPEPEPETETETESEIETESGESGVLDDPPRPPALPPRPSLPPTALPDLVPTAPPGLPPTAAWPDLPPTAAPADTVPMRPAVPPAPPPPYDPGPEVDPTPTDVLRVGGRREGAAPVAPTGRPDPAELLPTVLCPLGHANPPDTATCPRCGSEIAAQQPTPLPRAPMGVLELASGETVAVDRGVLVGRMPSWPGAAEDRPHLVQLTSPLGDISRTHLEVTLRGWDVVAVDLGSMNGTTVTGLDGGERELTAGDATVLADGDTLTIAEGVELRYRRES
jgi:hypothetical protein